MRYSGASGAGLLLILLTVPPVGAQQGSVVDTVHNLSISGPGEVKSLTERQVCKFCHVPHNSTSPIPMWSRKVSAAQFDTPQITVDGGVESPAPQPEGSSRLCLSCHDGTIALGEVAGEQQQIQIVGGPALRPGQSGFLGTDLSGSHPISIRMPNDSVQKALEGGSDLHLKTADEIAASPGVRLDSSGRMQCTTCHDPHSDPYFTEGRVPRFWVASTVTEVCLSCHIAG